ncbi:hypothetical protein [uncultured Fibrobacter sp.]|uniref:hypothetical protein n=1 Tax=uncultured Fibrobacter sp. TaxID=261512 RepID=UPI0025957D79|nr:hypothetical protein [uncultured Fibrobacter sp.]
MLKMDLLALALAFVSFVCSGALLWNRTAGPYFIESEKVLSARPSLQTLERRLALFDEDWKRRDSRLMDSIARHLDSLSVNREESERWLELLNLENSITRHRAMDSASKAVQGEIQGELQMLNGKMARFCAANGIPVLFASNNNSIVFGSGTKADKTGEFNAFQESLR